MVFATWQVKPPGVEEAVNVEETPSATKLTATLPEPATATVGVAKAVEAAGVNEREFAETATVSPPPLGVTVNWYGVPAVSPVTVHVSGAAATGATPKTSVQVGVARVENGEVVPV